jgi:hypothetical protein
MLTPCIAEPSLLLLLLCSNQQEYVSDLLLLLLQLRCKAFSCHVDTPTLAAAAAAAT